MNEALITNWNSVVPKKGTVYLLGDFAMVPKQADGTPRMKIYRSLRHRLNGKIYLCKGNHDKMSQDVYDLFTEVDGILEPKIDGEKIFLCHYPMLSWNGSIHGRPSYFGHVHGRLSEHPSRLSLDVGVDVPSWNYTPVSWEVLRKKTLEKEIIWKEYWFKYNQNKEQEV